MDEKFVARVAIGTAGEREKSVFTFHAESQCRRFKARRNKTRELSVRTAVRLQLGMQMCTPFSPPSPFSRSHSFSRSFLSLFRCEAKSKGLAWMDIPVLPEGDVVSFLPLWSQVFAEKVDKRGAKLVCAVCRSQNS